MVRCRGPRRAANGGHCSTNTSLTTPKSPFGTPPNRFLTTVPSTASSPPPPPPPPPRPAPPPAPPPRPPPPPPPPSWSELRLRPHLCLQLHLQLRHARPHRSVLALSLRLLQPRLRLTRPRPSLLTLRLRLLRRPPPCLATLPRGRCPPCLWHEPPTCGSNPRRAAAPVRRVLTRAYAYFPTS
eukprot:COSAG04_NODE_3192_length_3065_cov_21.232558_6_plen_183_part_00